MENHTFYSAEYDVTWDWSLQDILYAELIDFDNNGVPEMLLLIQWPQDEYDVWNYTILVFSYTDYVVQIYSECQHATNHFGVAVSNSGQTYLVSGWFGNRPFGSTYYSFENDNWVAALVLDGIGQGANDIPASYAINGIEVSAHEFDNASYSTLGIVDYFWFEYDTTNDVHSFLASLSQ